MAEESRQPSPGRPGRTRRPRSAAASAGAAPAEIEPGREVHWLRPPVRLNTGSSTHSISERRSIQHRLQGASPAAMLRPAIGRGGLLGERDGDPVDRLVGAIQRRQPCQLLRQFGRVQRGARHGRHAALVKAEFLVRKGLVAQQDALPGPDKPDRSARPEQLRLQLRAGRHDAEQRHIRRRVTALRGLD